MYKVYPKSTEHDVAKHLKETYGIDLPEGGKFYDSCHVAGYDDVDDDDDDDKKEDDKKEDDKKEDDKKEDDKKEDDKKEDNSTKTTEDVDDKKGAINVDLLRAKAKKLAIQMKTIRRKIQFRKTMLKILRKSGGSKKRRRRIRRHIRKLRRKRRRKMRKLRKVFLKIGKTMPDKGNTAVRILFAAKVMRLRQRRRRLHLKLLKKRGCCLEERLRLKSRLAKGRVRLRKIREMTAKLIAGKDIPALKSSTTDQFSLTQKFKRRIRILKLRQMNRRIKLALVGSKRRTRCKN